MNFLAHFHLAWPGEGLITGALEGDYYKGPLTGALPESIEQGIQLHRAIDAFTDSHPQVVDLRAQFPTGLRRYAGILIDLGFDHYLTAHWHEYHATALDDFARAVYQTLDDQERHLSTGARDMAHRLARYKLLTAYDDWGVVSASAARIGERFSRGNPMLEVEQPLAHLRPQFEQAFRAFYPQLQAFVEQRKSRSAPRPPA